MPKRKFGEFKQSNKVSSKASDGQDRHERAQAIIENGCIHVARALNVAKGFERPKLSKRQQAAGDDKEKNDRLEAEIGALKALNVELVARVHVYKTLLRIKTLSASNLIPAAAQQTIDSAKKKQSQANQNVQARLFKYPPVKAAVDEVVKHVRGCLPPDLARAKPKPNERHSKATNGDDDGHVERGSHDPAASIQRKGQRSGSEEATLGLPPALDESPSEEAADGHVSMDEEMIESFGQRIANADEEDSSADVDITRHTASDWSGSEADSDEIYDEHDTHQPKPSFEPEKLGNKTKLAAISNETMFLPTLSMGGYLSGSEDGSEIDDQATKIQPRKNRRGQRERQKIHEKKYGANASHLKKAVWDPRRGAQEASSRSKWKANDKGTGNLKLRNRKDRTVHGGPASSGANTEPLRERVKSKSEAPMHPSWEAARRAKEQKKAAPFQGKKITFD